MSNHATAQQSLQADVDYCVSLMDKPWKGRLMFEVASTCSRHPDRATIESTLQLQDIASFLGGQKPGYLRLYFNPTKYNSTPSHEDNGRGLDVSPALEQQQWEQQDDCTNDCTITTIKQRTSRTTGPPPDFHMLKKDIENASLQQDKQNGGSQCPLFSNGGSGGCRYTRRFHCAGCINRANTKRHIAQSIKRQQLKHTFRHSDIINDKRNSRGPGGKSMIRRTTSAVSNRSCTFGFTVRWDDIGFYVSLEKQSGCPFHRFHAPSNDAHPIPTRLLADDERQTLDHLAASCCTTGVGGAYIRSKLGRFMSKGKVAYVYSQARNDRLGGVSKEDSTMMSEYDHLTNYFESTQEIAYSVLWDVVPQAPSHDDQPQLEPLPTLDETPVHTLRAAQSVNSYATSTPVAPNMSTPQPHSSLLLSHTKLDNHHSCQKDHTEDDSMRGLRLEGALCRDHQQVPDNTKIFLAIAWVFKPELRFFKLFPEVIHVDATSHSTNKKYELLTFSVKTSLGRQVVFLRVWLPDQRRYSFRWVFQHVLTGLVPKEFFLRTRLVMSDGDRQQQQEIQIAIKEYMPNARLGSCGWHIVDRGWRRNGPMTNVFQSNRKKKEVQRLFQVVRRWIYSWMRPGYCETEEEYQVSAKLLNEYVDSPLFHTTVEGRLDIIAHLKQFIRQNILVYKELFLHYLRRKTRCLDIAHNSAHEGTNHGMKANAAAVLPSHSPVAAAERMVIQAFVTAKALEEESYRTLQQSKQWSSLPTAAHVVHLAESVLYQQVARYQKYSIVRIAFASFEVSFSSQVAFNRTDPDTPEPDSEPLPIQGDDLNVDQLPMPFDTDEDCNEERPGEPEETYGHAIPTSHGRCPIPRFRRTRTVTYDVNTYEFVCSCCQFERIGIPCVHIYAVVKHVDPLWEGFTHHHVAVRWWSIYISKGYPIGTTCPISRAIASLASNDISAPTLQGFGQMLNECSQDISTPTTCQSAWERVSNYDSDKLLRLFGTQNQSRGERDWEFMGHSQTSYHPDDHDDGEADMFDSDDVTTDNLFDGFDEEVTDNKEAKYTVMEKKLRSFLSIYVSLGSDEQSTAEDRVDILLSQTRADYARKEGQSGGTRSILVERHGARSRTYNTHNPYYR